MQFLFGEKKTKRQRKITTVWFNGGKKRSSIVQMKFFLKVWKGEDIERSIFRIKWIAKTKKGGALDPLNTVSNYLANIKKSYITFSFPFFFFKAPK